MKKATLLLFITLAFSIHSIAQFAADLAGYPLVTTGWTIGGTSTVIDSTVRLTLPTGGQSGYVYYSTPVDLTGCGQFTVDFDFQIIVSPSSTVADGIAFWYISNPPSGFATGGGIGLPSNPNGLLLILDSYDNTAPYNVPLETLLGYDGTVPGYVEGSATGVLAPVVGSQPFITDGSWHHCKIDYNMGAINVYFNYSATASLSGTYPMSISGYFGFSSSTGAAYSTQSVKSVHITAAGASPAPTVTSPVIYCQNDPASALTATGVTGSTIEWFSTDTGTVVPLSGAPVPSTTTLDTTWYFVRQKSGNCISAPDSIEVIVSPHPSAPVITGVNAYCQGDPFVAFTVTGATGTLIWNSVPTGGGTSTTPLTVPTSVPGFYGIWVSQIIAGCEGPRDSIGVKVTTTPPIPTVTGTSSYCQFIGPYVPVTPNLTTTGTARWYTTPTGGTSLPAIGTVDVTVPGTTTFYLSQIDSGCESSRGPIPITVNPKPAPPVPAPAVYCQFDTPVPLSATGTNLTWYGLGITPGYPSAPTPSTNVSDTVNYYVTQTSAFGCISDSAAYAVYVKPQPAPPVVADISYCRNSSASALTAAGSNLKWYDIPVGGTALSAAPVPVTTAIGSIPWYVTQTVNGCESNRSQLTVNTLYKPVFSIVEVGKSYVCQFDSLNLAYLSSDTNSVRFLWTLPDHSTFVSNTNDQMPSVMVEFDSVHQSNEVHLTVSTIDGHCFTDTSIKVNVVEIPSSTPFTKREVCLSDTVNLSLIYRSPTAFDYMWTIDGSPMATIGDDTMVVITSNSNKGGPYLINWTKTGMHIIEVTATTVEGCKASPSYDTVNVHAAPDATFKAMSKNGNMCREDSIQFIANTVDYKNTYMWGPDHSFENVNMPTTWGKLDGEVTSEIRLTVTDPFGCISWYSEKIPTNSCCKIFVPNAFTPGAQTNNRFHPVFEGYHNFHIFRMQNRWGQTIFESASSNPEWDGTFNGTPQDVGTYYYYIKYDCGGKTIEQKGDVTLVR